jgi:hypothetical protein
MSQYRFKLHIGDWSDDGHGKQEVFIINSNKPVLKARLAFIKAQRKVGINIKDLCSEYEQCTIKPEIMKKLKELGFDDKDFENKSEEDGTAWPGVEGFLSLVLWYIQQGDPTIKLTRGKEKLESFHNGRQNIGHLGYGLFS